MSEQPAVKQRYERVHLGVHQQVTVKEVRRNKVVLQVDGRVDTFTMTIPAFRKKFTPLEEVAA